MEVASFACIVLFGLWFIRSGWRVGGFCGFNLICLQEKSLEHVARIIFLRIILGDQFFILL